MSHVASVQIIIKDLESLKRACADLGLEFRENQKTYKWYGRWVNDYHAQEAAYKNGFDPKTFGQCEHAIGLPNNPSAYEVGVVKNPTGEGFTLLYDNWSAGYGLENVIGQGAVKIKASYAEHVARKQLARQGYRVHTQRGADGKVRLLASR